MNVSGLEQDDTEELFGQSDCFDEDLEAETSELINEVFNSNYEPIYNPSRTQEQEERYRQQKQQQNRRNKHKLAHHHKVYQNLDDEALPPSLRQFLARAQDKIEQHKKWVTRQKAERAEKQVESLRQVPDILRGSREKIQPIYDRCIQLQKDKQKKLEQQRIKKQRVESQKIQSIPFKPTIKNKAKQRTFEQYLADKETWKREKEEEVERQRVKNEAKKLSECTFAPSLVARYNKPNSRLIPGEKVEDRLLRSLQRSLDKN